MVAMANLNVPEKAVRQQIASAITIVVQVSRMSDGSRKVVRHSEITGIAENIVSMHEIFTFQRKGVAANGTVVGTFQATRIRPRFLEQLRVSGVDLTSGVFERTMEVTYRDASDYSFGFRVIVYCHDVAHRRSARQFGIPQAVSGLSGFY